MKCFTWSGGTIKDGFALTPDERLGQVVFLGETGRGRRFEKVAMSRHRPAKILEGRVYDAHLGKIELPARDGKEAKTFFVLEQARVEEAGVLVRVSTLTSYIRNGLGCWRIAAGAPETVVSGHGAFGDAGRIGTWQDGIVILRPGDVLKVFPSRGTEYALWIGADGRPQTATWQDYENLQAVGRAEATIGEAKETPAALTVLFATMRTFTFAGGEITVGLKVTDGATGKVVAFGEEGRGRSRIEVPLVGLEPVVQNDRYGQTTEVVEEAAVRVLDEKKIEPRWYGDKPEIKKIYGLVSSDRREDAFLVRVSTSGPYTKGTTGEVDPWKGSPTVITSGSGAHGDAGRVGGWDDVLLVMREGDVLFVRAEGGYKSAGPWALFVAGGDLRCEPWHPWKVKDGLADPAFYVAKGTAPMSHVPAEWVGRIVTVCSLSQEQSGCGPTKIALAERATGELVRVAPDAVVLNMGWDGRDYHEASVSGSWVKLETDKAVRRLEGAEAETRKRIRTEAEDLRAQATELTRQSHFALAEAILRHDVQELAQTQGFEAMPTEGWYESLTAWIKRAKEVLGRFAAVEPELKSLEQRQNSGAVLVDFGGHFRVMGATGQTQYWVIRPDGSERDPDEVSYRKRYTSEGEKKWRLVAPEELALTWAKGCTAASHEFIVSKLPDGGCTAAQLATVQRLEREISERFAGAVGMSGSTSPDIGDGWGLCKKSHQ